MKGGSFAADLLSVVRGRVGIARSAIVVITGQHRSACQSLVGVWLS